MHNVAHLTILYHANEILHQNIKKIFIKNSRINMSIRKYQQLYALCYNKYEI